MKYCTAIVEIETSHVSELLASLEPDNEKTPKHLSATCRPSSSGVLCSIRVDCSSPERVLTLRNTLDEIIVLSKTVLDMLGMMPRK
ncbi:MAG: hypothetical protein LRS48_03635 [Desulfurococcales archaeon]|nr:hypothetical protein [Desulfurococcales archaeon]